MKEIENGFMNPHLVFLSKLYFLDRPNIFLVLSPTKKRNLFVKIERVTNTAYPDNKLNSITGLLAKLANHPKFKILDLWTVISK